MIDQELFEKFAEQLLYEPESGRMTWLPKVGNDTAARRWNARFAGKQAGTMFARGYVQISLRSSNGKKLFILAHRLAWFMIHKTPPAGDIDHINQNPSDNRIANLRDVSRAINMRNATRRSNNKSGVTGVSWSKGGKKWLAQARINGKGIHIGLYANADEAAKAARAFRAANGFTENHGREVL